MNLLRKLPFLNRRRNRSARIPERRACPDSECVDAALVTQLARLERSLDGTEELTVRRDRVSPP